MHILITGAAGFIGQLLAAELLQEASHTVVLTDISEPPIPHGAKHPENARTVGADLCDAANSVVDKNLDAVFIFHGIMSAASEANFHLGMHVNVDSTRNLLEALRDLKPGVKVIYSSSQVGKLLVIS